MKKTLCNLVLGLSLVIGNVFAGANPSRELEERVKSLENNSETIVSCTKGVIDAPLGVIRDYVRKPVLSSKILMALGNSPYFCYPEVGGFTFINGSYTSRYQVVSEKETSNLFHHVSFIEGNRRFGNFSSSMELYFQSSSNKSTKYSNKMHVKLENGFFNSIIKNLLEVPLIGKGLKRFFEEEQDKILRDINQGVQRAKNNPEVLAYLQGYTNQQSNIYFTQPELEFFKRSVELSK